MDFDFIKEQLEMTNEIQRKAYQAGYEQGRKDEKQEWGLKEKREIKEAMARDEKTEERKEEIMSPKDELGFYQEY